MSNKNKDEVEQLMRSVFWAIVGFYLLFTLFGFVVNLIV